MSGDDSSQFSLLQNTLGRMEQQLSRVCTDVEELKRSQRPPKGVAQLPGNQQRPGMVQSKMAQSVIFKSTMSVVFILVTSVNGADNSIVTTRLPWSEQMEL